MFVKWGQNHHRLRPHLRVSVCILFRATSHPWRVWRSSGAMDQMEEILMTKKSGTSQQKQRDNRANQLNPNNVRYWMSRGQPGRPPSEHPSKSAPSPKVR